MLSFWEKDFFVEYDHIIVGSGIVGLSTAVSLKEKDPKAKVLVLERGIFPTGASTKNAGFACFGSLSELAADLKTLSEDEVFELVKLRWEGLQLLRRRLGDEPIDFKNYGGYEILQASEMHALDHLDKVNELLFPLFNNQVYGLQNKKINELGFPSEKIEALVFNPFESQVHTGKLMKSLWHYAAALGIEVFTGAQVVASEEHPTHTEVALADGPTFKARQLAFCTNAFSKFFFPKLDLEPGRGTVLVTEPIKDLNWKGTFHYDEGYYYFRNYQDRVIFGGGRNLDLKTEQTTNFNINQKILEKLKEDLREIILPEKEVKVEHVWSGIMAFGPDKMPILQKPSERTTVGVRLGGMGVAIGSQLGRELAEMMLQ